MEERTTLKILFICTLNRMRSATAEKIFADDDRFEVASAGTDLYADKVISPELLNWADRIVIMEKHHSRFIKRSSRTFTKTKKIVCLNIPDHYHFMQPELISALLKKFGKACRKGLI